MEFGLIFNNKTGHPTNCITSMNLRKRKQKYLPSNSSLSFLRNSLIVFLLFRSVLN